MVWSFNSILPELRRKNESGGNNMNCGLCDKTDGMCYTSQPPQVKCTVTGEFHLFSDKCNVIELFQQVKAERDAAVRALEGSCHECKHYTGFHHRGKCINCRHDFYGAHGNSNWEWRGPQNTDT